MHYTNSDMRNAIEEHIHSERDRQLLLRRLIDGIRFEPLSEEFQLSVRQTKNIVYREKARLFELMHQRCTNAD